MPRQPRENWIPLILVLGAAVIGALPPLHEMDLAQHLATGDWIARHHAVPFTEPFAWTRPGQPYFAYSWFAQLLFYDVLRAFGPFGLHLLEAALVGSAVAAALATAHMLGWSRPAQYAFAALHLALLWGVAPTLRPQQFLFITLPLTWGLAARIHARGPSPGRLAALCAVSALAANTHIFFPLTAIPIGYFLVVSRERRAVLLAGGAVFIGWLISPYAFTWPQVFALNFGHNVLLDRPPSIAEFVPGFEYARARTGVVVAAAALLAAPWLTSAPTRRERVTHAVCWIAGLMLFAYAGRLVVAWWMLAFPLLGAALQRAAQSAGELLRRPLARLSAAGIAAIIIVSSAAEISPIFWYFEGDAVHRMLPRAGEDPALWLPGWLLCNTKPDAHGRIFTEFNYGSELNWRLPKYSPSIDGRTIFPDSDAVEFSFQANGRRVRHATTWMHADLALFDRTLWLAPVLDQNKEWLLLAESRRTSRGNAGGLWAKREWWQRYGTTSAIPARDVRIGDPRAICAATGPFPRE